MLHKGHTRDIGDTKESDSTRRINQQINSKNRAARLKLRHEM